MHGNDQATGPSEAAGDAVEAALKTARQHLQAERLPDARLACEQALRLDSTCAQAWNLLGGVAWHGGNLESAIELIGKATTLDPGNGEFWCNLAGAQGALKRMDEAARSLQGAIEADPSNAGIHTNLGNIYRGQGKYRAAIACYRQALEIDPLLAGTHNSLGYSLFRQGDLRGAVGPYQRSLELEPANPHLLNRLGSIYLDLQAYDDAESCFRRALTLDPDFALALNNLGLAFQDQDRFEEAIEQYRCANEIDPNFAEPYANLGSVYLRLGDARAALAASDEALRLAPGNCSVLAYKAFAHLSLEEEPQARVLLDYQRLISVQHPDPPEGYGSIAEFNQALSQQILTNPTLRKDPDGKTTTIGRQTGELIGEEGAFAVLEDMIRKAFEDYLENLPRDQTHPYLAHRLSRFAMGAWAVVLENQGHQKAHIHPWAWASAVYYVKLPSTITDRAAEATAESAEPPGGIEFGRPRPGVAAAPPPWLRQVRPEEGLLVIFPSYFWHRTIPFESEETRISVAFDAFGVD